MFTQAIFPNSVADGTMSTPHLIIGFAHAGVLLAALLAVCCGILWHLSKPLRPAPSLGASVRSSHTKTKRSGRSKARRKGKSDFAAGLPDAIPLGR